MQPVGAPEARRGATTAAKAKAGTSTDAADLDIQVEIGEQFEECLELKWTTTETCREFFLEMVLDRGASGKPSNDKDLKPAKDATVKRVNMGRDTSGSIQNMPEGRSFLVRVVGKLQVGKEVYSPWTRAITLSPKTRDKDLGNLDPMNMPRMNCNNCPCACYVPFRWGLNSPGRLRCRRCGCHHTEHQMVEVGEILKAREVKAKSSMGRDVTPLPQEALDWDERECSMWFCSGGAVHPRQIRTKSRSKPKMEEVKGRVSIVTPTTESRHKFHEQLYRCFDAQTWPDKELVIVETYTSSPSEFFAQKAQMDPRVVYVKFQRSIGDDFSIGLKRNVGTHLASGEVIASFDDDDLYAPPYLDTMVNALQDRRALAVKLSNWYVYHIDTDTWSFCDPIAWGLTKGLDETSDKVKSWAYGYGFSYVYRRQCGLDLWYGNINLGEDFNWMMQLQLRRGERSVHLVPDDFGMCLHVQHGGNTSNSIPVREVPDSEAMDLDIMELNQWMHASGPAGRALARAIGRSKTSGSKQVACHLPHAEYLIENPPKATVNDLLKALEDQLRIPCDAYKVYRVPPPVAFGAQKKIYPEERRGQIAADVLGISFLAKLPGAEENLQPHTKSGQQWCKLTKAAQQSLRGTDRLGPRVDDVWVLPPEQAAAAGLSTGEETWEEEDKVACAAAEEESKKSFITRVTCQSSTVKKFFTTKQSFGVYLPKGATVSQLRWVLGRHLPAEARVLCQRQGRDIQVMQETDVVPEEITVSDFRGPRSFYMRFTDEQCAIVLRFMRSFFKNPENQKRLDEFEASAKGSGHDYRAQLVQLLAHEVYPRIYQKLHVPVMDDLDGPKLMLEAMSNVSSSNLQVVELWLEVELLMRNQASAQSAIQAVQFFRNQANKSQGITKVIEQPSYEHIRDAVQIMRQVGPSISGAIVQAFPGAAGGLRRKAWMDKDTSTECSTESKAEPDPRDAEGGALATKKSIGLAETVGGDGAIPVDVLKVVLERELEGHLGDFGQNSADEILQTYMQPDADGVVGFLQFWKGMEEILRARGTMRTYALTPAQKEAIAGFRFLRTCLLDMAARQISQGRSSFSVRELRYFMDRTIELTGLEGQDFWRQRATQLPEDPEMLVTGEEVASALSASSVAGDSRTFD
ncbi:unnamed protein product [Durusdinium trenchii]|uniref:Glycosyltransferase 2-like domain-containing protein n=1 Tax=Durusdinium trenchii TaxID=1381693 RepID=A0ABP0QGD4_9DINO